MSDVPGGQAVHRAAGGTGSAIKRVPKWAWIAGGGIAGGIIFMRMRSHQGADASRADNGDATAPGDYGQQAYPGGLGPTQGAAPSQGDNGAGPVAGPTLDEIIAGVIGALPLPDGAGGGGAPEAPTQGKQDPEVAPTPPPPPVVNVYVPAATPAAPAPPPPTVVAQTPQCGGQYPFSGPSGCYKVVIASGKGDHKAGRWHFYQNGKEVYVGP